MFVKKIWNSGKEFAMGLSSFIGGEKRKTLSCRRGENWFPVLFLAYMSSNRNRQMNPTMKPATTSKARKIP